MSISEDIKHKQLLSSNDKINKSLDNITSSVNKINKSLDNIDNTIKRLITILERISSANIDNHRFFDIDETLLRRTNG